MMSFIFQKLPFVLELFFSGPFILLYSLYRYSKLPKFFGEELTSSLLTFYAKGIPLIIFFVIIASYLNVRSVEKFFRKYIFSLIVFFALMISWGDLEFSFWLSSVHLLSSVLALYESDSDAFRGRGLAYLRTVKFSPAQIVLLTFAALIFVGTGLLMLPFASKGAHSFPFIDALFMATSATCVTGLSTLSLANQMTFFGQIVILTLIQVGGLGIMILYASMTIIIGRSMPMKERVIMQDILDVASMEELIGLIIDIIKYTFIIELWGAIVLTIAFILEGYEFGASFYYGVFHSISAFCNAGLSLFDNSLENFATKPMIHFTVATLITLGGLGFMVLKEIKHLFNKRMFRWNAFGLHAKIVLSTSAILVLVGAMVIFFGEFLSGLDQYSLWEKIQISIFQSVTLRTAGYTTVPLVNFNSYTLYMMIMLMFIGAGPGSTAGGIKVSTFAILIQSIRSTLKGRETVEIFDRSIPNSVVVKATALAIISIMLTTLSIFILLRLEPNGPFLHIIFEAVSAFGTVGLSLGITGALSSLGKFCIIMLMYAGRVGPLTLLLAIGQKKSGPGRLDYPEGKVIIG